MAVLLSDRKAYVANLKHLRQGGSSGSVHGDGVSGCDAMELAGVANVAAVDLSTDTVSRR